MNNMEVIKNFLITGKVIYTLSLIDAESEGFEAPDSVTVSGTGSDGKIIEISITIKEGDENEEEDEDEDEIELPF